MKYNDVSFNEQWVSSFKTEAEFIKEMSTDAYKHIFESSSPADRKKQLGEVYKICLEAKPNS